MLGVAVGTTGDARPPAPAEAAVASTPTGATPGRTFADWKTACLRLPSNRALRGNPVPAALLPLPRFEELDELLTAFFAECRTGSLGQTNLWQGETPTGRGFFNTDTAYFLAPDAPKSALVESFLTGARSSRTAPPIRFQPFALRLQVPEDSEVFVHADLHGDIRSLLADLTWLNDQGYLCGFMVAKPGFHMVFFGDYTDRGSFGIEVLYTLLRLKLANPDRVFLARGNHEEVSLAARYGFLSEGRLKYGPAFNVTRVMRAYDFLPVVIYLGKGGDYIQCNHGGMEPGYDPRRLLDSPGPAGFQFLGTLNQRQFLSTHPGWFAPSDAAARQQYNRAALDFRPDDPINPVTLGFMWNDFTLVSEEPGFAVDPGRAFVYGQHATQYLLEQTRTASNVVQAVFRGHQQSQVTNPMMRRLLASRGVFRHWQAGDSMAKFGAGIHELEGFLEHEGTRAIPAGSVWTFNISPDSAYGEANGFTYDAFGILKTSGKFPDWRLRVINVEVAP